MVGSENEDLLTVAEDATARQKEIPKIMKENDCNCSERILSESKQKNLHKQSETEDGQMLQTPDNNTSDSQVVDQAHSYSGGIRTLPRLSAGQNIQNRFAHSTHSEHNGLQQPDSAVPDSVIYGQTCATTEQEVQSPGYPDTKRIFKRPKGNRVFTSKTNEDRGQNRDLGYHQQMTPIGIAQQNRRAKIAAQANFMDNCTKQVANHQRRRTEYGGTTGQIIDAPIEYDTTNQASNS